MIGCIIYAGSDEINQKTDKKRDETEKAQIDLLYVEEDPFQPCEYEPKGNLGLKY